MREGPVPDVQMTIQIAQDKVIAITPDPTPLQNHFGDTPIYGIVASPEMMDSDENDEWRRTDRKL